MSIERAPALHGRERADALIGFAVVNPRLPGAVDGTRRALGTHRLRDLEMVPSGRAPADLAAREARENG